MPNYSFADYENAVLQTLADLKAPTGYLKTLAGYSGEFNEDVAFENFLQGFPGVLVEIAAAEYSQTELPFPPVIVNQTVTVQLYVAALSWRDQAAARKGATGVTGAYTILADIRKYLLGKTLGLQIRPVVPQGEFKINHELGSRVVLYGAKYLIVNDRILEQ